MERSEKKYKAGVELGIGIEKLNGWSWIRMKQQHFAYMCVSFSLFGVSSFKIDAIFNRMQKLMHQTLSNMENFILYVYNKPLF